MEINKEVDVSEFKKGDKVKIVNHPRHPKYCGLEGIIQDVRKGPGVHTQGMGPTDQIPDHGSQLKYDVEVQYGPQTTIVSELVGEWLELC